MNRFYAIALGLFTFLVLLFSAPALAQDASIEAPERGLQTELEPVSADMDWRAEVGLTEAETPDEGSLPVALAWIVANLVMIIFLGIVLVAIVLIVMVLVNYGGGGGFRAGAEAAAGARVDRVDTRASIDLDAPRLGLDEILALDDLEVALGALLGLVLEAALNLTGSVLRRSSTAREIVRRLPSDFAHLSVVAMLVREAERVRYGGGSITRDRFEELVGLVRPMLGSRRST